MVFIGGVENGNFLLVGVFQVIVEAFQAQVAPATLGQGKAELQTRPLLNVWQILQNHLLLQGYRRSAEHDGFVQTLRQRNGGKAIGGSFTGAGTRLNHGNTIFISRQGPRNLRDHLALTAPRLKVSGRQPSAVGGLNFVFYSVGQGGHSAAL